MVRSLGLQSGSSRTSPAMSKLVGRARFWTQAVGPVIGNRLGLLYQEGRRLESLRFSFSRSGNTSQYMSLNAGILIVMYGPTGGVIVAPSSSAVSSHRILSAATCIRKFLNVFYARMCRCARLVLRKHPERAEIQVHNLAALAVDCEPVIDAADFQDDLRGGLVEALAGEFLVYVRNVVSQGLALFLQALDALDERAQACRSFVAEVAHEPTARHGATGLTVQGEKGTGAAPVSGMMNAAPVSAG